MDVVNSCIVSGIGAAAGVEDPDGFNVLKPDSGSEMGVEEPETPRISARAVDEVAASLLDFRKRAL